MNHTTLVSTDTLAAHLDAGWAIVDCRYDLQQTGWGHEQYRAAHVPGAVYASLSHDLAGPAAAGKGRHPLPSVEQMATTFARLGIDRDTQVVAYDQDSGMFASRLWWMLRYLGHDAVAVLDGGWAKWTREERPARSGDESRPAAAFAAAPRADRLASLEDVVATYRDPGILFVDARAAERFEGHSEPLDRLPGHIPGAANYFHKQNAAPDGTMLPAETLRQQLTSRLAGHSPERTVMYCGSGVSACFNLLAMEQAGLPGAKLYVGSWSEWSSDPDRPVETGPARR